MADTLEGMTLPELVALVDSRVEAGIESFARDYLKEVRSRMSTGGRPRESQSSEPRNRPQSRS